jgi:nucleoside-diphosphate-sugar epimerase
MSIDEENVMHKHVIVGAGPVGSALARLLADRGDEVTVITRSGSGPDRKGVRLERGDATDTAAVTALTAGATALYNCASPAYHRWATDWPPLAAALLNAAEQTGAVLVTASNLYGYGKVTAPMTEDTPFNPHGAKGRVRAKMWTDALARHHTGQVRVTEVRAADYIGPDAQSHLGARVVPRLLAGKGVKVLPSADQPHSWTYVDDVAALLAAVGGDERAWGRAWHVPTNPPRSQREAVADLCRIAGVQPVSVSEVPGALLRMMALFNRQVRELPEVAYQLKQPFVIDSTAAQQTFKLNPTPWDTVLTTTIEHYRQAQTMTARR